VTVPAPKLLRATPFHRGAVVPANALGDELSHCPCCGSSMLTRAVTLQTEPDVSMRRCEDCGACSASRQPTMAYLGSYYATYYDGAESGHTFHETKRLARHIRANASSWQPAAARPVRIVDFGSGDGAVALALATDLLAGSDGVSAIVVDVVDLHPRPLQPPAGVHVRPHTGLDTVEPRADIVLASAILEHLHAPEEALGKLVDLLAPAGILYARTPFNVQLAKWVGSFDLGYPGHLHDLGPDWWNGLIARHDWPLEVLRSAPSIVETSITKDPVRTVLAHALKFPAHVQARVRGTDARGAWWPICGGWEVIWRRAGQSG
jgi:SAM-dependent methyltransferase